MAPDSDEVREHLRAVGERRKALKRAEEQLARDTGRAVKRARKAKVPMTEVANLVGLERTYLYRGYR